MHDTYGGADLVSIQSIDGTRNQMSSYTELAGLTRETSDELAPRIGYCFCSELIWILLQFNLLEHQFCTKFRKPLNSLKSNKATFQTLF